MFPIINRGTWARVYAISQILKRFLATYVGVSKVNIVSLGAGYDSTYFWLKKNDPEIDSKIDYIEIDFEHIVKRKVSIIKDKQQMLFVGFARAGQLKRSPVYLEQQRN